MEPTESLIPDFRADGYLPTGLYLAPEAEVVFRFGAGTRRQRRLVIRLRHWVELARHIGARRLLIDGSFVTAKPEPNDLDAVILLPIDFELRIEQGVEAALELYEMLETRQPEEIFAAGSDDAWNRWVEFFSRTREADGRRKGLVEIQL